MMEVNQALEQVLGTVNRLPACGVPLLGALGKVAARDVLASVALPGFDNSAMDGYAVRAEDAARGAILSCVGEQAAGVRNVGLSLGKGEAVRIFTGGQIPVGADAVVMQEDVRLHDGGARVEVADDVELGQFIRRRGSDLCPGQVILRSGDVVNAARIGLLASQGRVQVDVVSDPVVAVLTTGNELVSPGVRLAEGQLYNSNAPMLEALVRAEGIAGVSASHCRDEKLDTVTCLKRLTTEADVVIVSGGVSVGDHDWAKPALEEVGLPPVFWRVRMKPGKPFLFAHGNVGGRERWVFGLPGNPVSSFVTFLLLVRPALRALRGLSLASDVVGVVTERLDNAGDRPLYVRGQYSHGSFAPVGLQRSDALFSLSLSDGLVRVEPGEVIPPGSKKAILM